jgi:hypothetical protein
MKKFNKIFQIGFNKCGTNSINILFQDYSIPRIKCCHWDSGFLGYSMVMNERESKPLLSGKYENFGFYSDMECQFVEDDGSTNWIFMYDKNHIPILDEQYPNSKFILNIRDVDNWIKSRMSHLMGLESVKKDKDRLDRLHPRIPYKELHKEFFGCSNDEQIEHHWRQSWNEHIAFVQDYFKDRPQDLLIFDIEKDTIKKFKRFFAKCGIDFNINEIPHANKTKHA